MPLLMTYNNKMELHAKVGILLVLVLVLALASSSPYHLQDWMVKEHLSPYDREICIGDTPKNTVCMTRDDMQLFKDKRLSPNALCLGNPKVCIDDKQLQKIINGPPAPTCRDTSTPWNDFGNGNYAYLDRHDVKCADTEKLVRQRVQVDWKTNKSRVNYRCCR